MNKIGKMLAGTAIFVSGYLVGFYEMKYKLFKAIAEGVVEKSKEERKEGSQ